jgi:hypothetical protein
MWRGRYRMRVVRWLAVLVYIGLYVVMKVPPYFLIARFDLAGGSTGWHRAELIDSAIRHFDEWWLTGTDYTRGWMPTGVSWSPTQTDVTNYYLYMGVLGGLLLMLLFVCMLSVGFVFIGKIVRTGETGSPFCFVAWALGASLFAHAVTCISVAYFDQSFLFLYLSLAATGSSYAYFTVQDKVEDISPVHLTWSSA